MQKIKVFVADDQEVVLLGIEAMLKDVAEIELVGFTKNARDTLSILGDYNPDILLLDIIMPDTNDLSLARHIIHNFPHIKIIMLTMSEQLDHISEAIEIGVKGYLLKDALRDDLRWAIQLVNKNYSAFKTDFLQQCFLEKQQIIELNDRNILIPVKKKKQFKIKKLFDFYLTICQKITLIVGLTLQYFCNWLNKKLFK